MRFKFHFITLITIFLLASYKTSALAQAPTFGPICEGTPAPNVTCVPPTSTTAPTAKPQPPVSGMVETTLVLLGIGGVISLAGATSLIFSRER